MRISWLAPAGIAAAALVVAACGGSSAGSGTTAGSSHPASAAAPAAASSAQLKTAKVGGVTVLTNAKGFVLYSFVPDTATTSKCNGACAKYWPPVKAPASAGSGVTGKLTVITRSDGAKQAAYNGHPLYTYVGDTKPGEAKGNGLNLSGGVWHEVVASGAAAPAAHPSSSKSSGGGGGYGY